MQKFKLSLVSLLSIVSVSSSVGQEIRVVEILASKPQLARHLGVGPVDMNNLSPDILNCDVCRQRLGLPPTSPAKSPYPMISNPSSHPFKNSQIKTDSLLEQIPPVPMLGSPGLISSLTAEKMAQSGLVVEEFMPPHVRPDAIQLDGIPREVREQFLQSLQLPYGAKVMSAKVAQSAVPTPAIDPRQTVTEAVPETQPSPEEFDAIRLAMEERLDQMQLEWQKRMTQADTVNKEVLSMLEKRTAEVSELQSQLKAQQEALAKASAELEAKSIELSQKKTDAKDTKKKAPNKPKAPKKPAIAT